MSDYKILQEISSVFQTELNLAKSNLEKAKKSEALNFPGFIEPNEKVFNFYEKTYEFYIKSLFYEEIKDEKELLEETITWLTEAYKDLAKFNRFCSDVRDAGDLQENKLYKLIKEVLQEKEDRCKRIADRKYDKPSAYKSGAIVRCRQRKIWKNLKEEKDYNSSAKQKIDNLPKGKIFDDAKNIENIFNKSQHSWSETLELFEKNKHEGEEQYINVKDIHITQPNIQSNKAKQIITNLDKTPIINVVEFPDGEKVIYDGHHRLVANWALGNEKIKTNLVKVNNLQEDESLHKWFKRQGPKGKEGGWVDCNAPDGKGGYKACGRKEGEKRAKYPSCRPTPAKCKTKGKGKKWGKTK